MFSGLIDRDDFAAALGKRNLALLAATLSWPFILAALMPLTGCRGVGGACGAVGLVASLYLKPLIYLVFIAALIPICMKRCRDGGLSLWTVLPLMLVLFIGIGFWTVESAPWSVSFSLGAMGGVPPVVVAGFAALVFMCFVLSDAPPKHFEAFLVVLGIVAIAPLLMSYLWIHSLMGGARSVKAAPISTFFQATAMLAAYTSLLLEIAPFALAMMALREWKKSSLFDQQSFQKNVVLGLGLIVSLASVFCLAVSLTSSIAVLAKIKIPLLSILQATSYARLAELLALLALPFAISAHFRESDDGFVAPVKSPPPNPPQQRDLPSLRAVPSSNQRTGFGKRQLT